MSISPSEIRAAWARLSAELLARYPLSHFEGDARDDYAVISRIQVKPSARGQGVGARAMRDVLAWADANGVTLALTPDPSYGGNKRRLTAWYRSLGFAPNKGRNADYRISESMVRAPGRKGRRRRNPALGAEVALQFRSAGKSLAQTIRAVERAARRGGDLYVGGEFVPATAVLADLQALQPPALPGGARVTVYHATTAENADHLLRDGFHPALKPWTLAAERYAAGQDATFAPGAGVSRGLYVGASPRAVEGYGRVTLAVTAPVAWLSVPPELAVMGVTRPLDALKDHDGAVIERPLPASAFTRVTRNPRRRNPAKREADLPAGVHIRVTGTGPQRTFTYAHTSGAPASHPRGRLVMKRHPEGWMVTGVSASRGWGPLLYDTAMAAATPDGGLMADRREVSVQALRVWERYAQRPDVTRTRVQGRAPLVRDYTTERHVMADTDPLRFRYQTRRRNPQNLEARSDRVIRHLVTECGMSREEATAAVGRHKGEASDRPALTPEGLKLYERAVKRVIRMAPYRAAFLLLPRTGLRIGELVTMTWDRALRDQGVFVVVGKNSDVREVPVTRDAWEILDRYEQEYKPRGRSPHWMFPRWNGPDHVSVSRAGAAMRAIRHAEPRLKDLTPHVLRHTFATQKLRECMPPAKLREVLGHRGKAVNMVYLHL